MQKIDKPTHKFRVHMDDTMLEPIKDGYAELYASIEPLKGEEVYVVTVVYTTGDSFGRYDEPRHEHVDAYRTVEEACEVAESIRAHEKRTKGWDREPTDIEDQLSMNIKFGNGELHRIHCPWTGYFEQIEYVEVQQYRVGSPKKMRF